MDEFWSVALPSWLTGIGTVGLAGFAVWGIRNDRAEKAQLRAQAQQERSRADEAVSKARDDEKEREHRAQASSVFAWPDDIYTTDGNFIMDPGYVMNGWVPAAVVMNDSPLPIFDVNVAWCHEKGPAVLETRHIKMVPPHDRRQYARPYSLVQQSVLPIEIDFRDASGTLWKRHRDGTLEEL